MAKKVTFSYILKNKDRKVTESFARAKYFGVYYGKKAVLSLRQFPKDVKNAKQRIALLEEVFAYLLVIESEAKNKKVKQKEKKLKETTTQRYAKYVQDVNASKPIWSKMFFRHQDEILAEEDKARKARAKKEKKKFRKINRTRFSFYEVPVSTRSEIYSKFFRVRVIKSKMLGPAEELEMFVDLKKPISIQRRENQKSAETIFKVAYPHLIKSYRNIRKNRRKNIHVVLRFYYNFEKSKGGDMRGWGYPRIEIQNEKDLIWILREAIESAIKSESAKDLSAWLRYLQSNHSRYLYVQGFNAQFAYGTKYSNTDQINLRDYKNDFITTVK